MTIEVPIFNDETDRPVAAKPMFIVWIDPDTGEVIPVDWSNLGVGEGGSPVDITTLMKDTTGFLIRDALVAAVPELAKTPALTATDMDTPVLIDSTATGSRVIKAAVALQQTRVHAYEFQVDGACDVTIKRGATVLYVRKFGASGGGGEYRFRERPYFKTGINEALTIETTNNVRLLGTFELKTEA